MVVPKLEGDSNSEDWLLSGQLPELLEVSFPEVKFPVDRSRFSEYRKFIIIWYPSFTTPNFVVMAPSSGLKSSSSSLMSANEIDEYSF